MIENVFDSLLSHELREEAVFFMSVIFQLIVVDFVGTVPARRSSHTWLTSCSTCHLWNFLRACKSGIAREVDSGSFRLDYAKFDKPLPNSFMRRNFRETFSEQIFNRELADFRLRVGYVFLFHHALVVAHKHPVSLFLVPLDLLQYAFQETDGAAL
ncbi:MAG: hypothetical protein MSS51_09115 [Bacteroidales bacterium]|nr:hypothetical protein [Bacteroidales bacterium]